MTSSDWPTPIGYDPAAGTEATVLEAVAAATDDSAGAMLLVAGARARRDGWAARAVVGLTAALDEAGRALLLTELTSDRPELHERFDVDNVEGLVDVFLFGASLHRIAHQPPGHGFYFAPRGAHLPDPREVLSHDRWTHLVARFSRASSLLMIYVPADTPGLELLARRVGRAVLLAAPDELSELADALPGECSVGAVLRPASAAESEAAMAVSPDEPAGAVHEDRLIQELVASQRRARRRRWLFAFVGMLVLAALAVGGWMALQYYQVGDVGRTIEAGAAGVAAAEPVESPVPFSVVIESYQDLGAARERVVALRDDEPEIGFAITPVLQDSVVYYQIVAGPVADSAGASALLQRLVDAGHKRDAQQSAVRNTPLAYNLGDFETAAAAEARGAGLRDAGVPTYVIEVPRTSGPPQYRLYAGAYEERDQAEVMAQFLRDAGVDAPLVRRIGRASP